MNQRDCTGALDWTRDGLHMHHREFIRICIELCTRLSENCGMYIRGDIWHLLSSRISFHFEVWVANIWAIFLTKQLLLSFFFCCETELSPERRSLLLCCDNYYYEHLELLHYKVTYFLHVLNGWSQARISAWSSTSTARHFFSKNGKC